MTHVPSSPVDAAFLKIMSETIDYVITCAETAALTIVETSGSYLSGSAHQALQNFHDLYSEKSDINSTLENYNRDVDDLFDSIQAQVEQGIDVQASDINSQSEVERVTISGLQKQLETIIRLDSGIKERLIPVLSSMQFEDLIRSSLSNLKVFWTSVLQTAESTPSEEWKTQLLALGEQTKSTLERERFFHTVVHQDVPASLKAITSIDWVDELAS